MSVLRQANILGQQRIDVPHLRAVESSICADFDLLAGKMLGGANALVLSGFQIVSTGAVTATDLYLSVADSTAIHYLATESGSIFNVPSDRAAERLNTTNPRVIGGFVPNSTNYIGLDFIRVVDDDSADLSMFLDNLTAGETPKTVPLARVIDYRIIVSTRDFNNSPGICPVAKVVTGAGNQLVSIVDARNMMYRLGSGGTNPNPLNFFTWPAGRTESATTSVFSGADKNVTNLKGWMDAIMSRLWEQGGGEHWYSPTAERNVRLIQTGSPFLSTGEHWEWDGTHAHWKGQRLVFDNSTASYNDVLDQTTNLVGSTNLADGECLYVDVDRTTNRTGGTALVAQKTFLTTVGMGTPPGSSYVIAWRFGTRVYTRDQSFYIGSSFKIATTSANGTSTLSATPTTPSAPIVASATDTGLNMGMSGFSRKNTGTTGDLTIGLGTAAGDRNINLNTSTSPYNTSINGYNLQSSTPKAALDVTQHGVSGGFHDNRILQLKADLLGPSIENRFFVEGSGAFGQANLSYGRVETPVPSTADPARFKHFARADKTWHTPVNYATAVTLPTYVATGSGISKVLTGDIAYGPLTIDGTSTVLNSRILVKDANSVDRGIYYVSQIGSAGVSSWKLTRATDLSENFQLWEGVAVKVLSGTVNAGSYWMLQTSEPMTLDTSPLFFAQTNNITKDQACIKWWNGSVTVVAESPGYAVP